MKRRWAMKIIPGANLVFSSFAAFTMSYDYPLQKFLALSRRMGFEQRRSIVERRENKCVDIKN